MKLRKYIVPTVSWIAVVFWMTFIFCMSAEPAPESKETSGGVSRIILKIFVRDFEELPEETQEAMIEDVQHYVRKYQENYSTTKLLKTSLTKSENVHQSWQVWTVKD